MGEEPDDIEEMMMMKTIHFVCTTNLVQKLNPDREIHNSPGGRPGIMSVPLNIDPPKIASKFGRWLAESVLTTSRDDDLSIIWVTHRATRWDNYVGHFADRLRATRPSDSAGIEAVLHGVETWVQEQREILAAYGEKTLLERGRAPFEWPVLGSKAADGIEEPEAYFDLCAGRIRAMRPLAVTNYRGVDVPDSLQVCTQ